MGWVIRYSRVGNNMPIYACENPNRDTPEFGGSVDDVVKITGHRTKSVRIACKEAREDGVSHFLD